MTTLPFTLSTTPLVLGLPILVFVGGVVLRLRFLVLGLSILVFVGGVALRLRFFLSTFISSGLSLTFK